MENVSRAALSPDGRTLAFFRAAGNDYAGLHQLWLASPPTSQPVQYTRPPFGDRRGYSDATMLHFSPDGSKIPFRSEKAVVGIDIIPALGGEAHLLARYARSEIVSGC